VFTDCATTAEAEISEKARASRMGLSPASFSAYVARSLGLKLPNLRIVAPFKGGVSGVDFSALVLPKRTSLLARKTD
jgi:hypothetical protein